MSPLSNNCPRASVLTDLQYAFSRDFRKKGFIALNTYLRQYRLVARGTDGSNSG